MQSCIRANRSLEFWKPQFPVLVSQVLYSIHSAGVRDQAISPVQSFTISAL